MKAPNPGSNSALSQGCVCPVMDNSHGQGRGGDGERFGWYMRTDCPLHGTKQPQAPSAPEKER